jgi:hypothetical protein
MLLLPVDIALRRLIVTRSDIKRVQMALFGFRRAVTPEGPSERLSSLMGAKARGRQRAEDIPGSSTVSALRSSREQSRAEREAQATATPEAGEGDTPRYVPTRNQPAREEGASTASELLKSRRSRRKDDE